VKGDPELMCPRVIDAERLPPGTSASADRNILHPFQVSLKIKRKRKLGCVSLSPFEFPHFFPSLFL
jgi:hypothetical protein